jgi:class 3 adenylate cyclase
MDPKLSPSRGSVGSNALDKRLKEALSNIEQADTKFKSRFLNQWTIMFCDVSRKIGKIKTEYSDTKIQSLTMEFRDYVLKIANVFDPPYVAPGDGPQLVICFETPEQAAEAAVAIQNGLRDWRYRTDGAQHFRPSIGLHTGEFVLKDGELRQSNACNLGKRIETQANFGKIFISSTTFEALKDYGKFTIGFVKNAMVKNIPEPQDIYSLHGQTWIDVNAQRTKLNNPLNLDLPEEDIDSNMGILICDVSGSTRKFWILGDREGNQLIETFQKEVLMILRKYKAKYIEQCEGDMIIACFWDDKPIINVLAAIEIQKNFFRRNTNLATRTRQKIETSIGIHYGNVVIRNQKLVPTPDFLACKGIQDLAQANEISMSQSMRELIQEYSSFKMDDLGEVEIKGFTDPLHVYTLQWSRTTG